MGEESRSGGTEKIKTERRVKKGVRGGVRNRTGNGGSNKTLLESQAGLGTT